MPDEQQHQEMPPPAETQPAPEAKPPKPPAPSRAERQERAREVVAEQRLEQLQTQIQGLQGQLGAVGQHLIQQNNAQWEQRLAEMSPAERAEARSQQAVNMVQNLTNTLQNQQRGQQQETPEQRYERRSRELEQEHGIPRDEWPDRYVKAGESATIAWLEDEARRREAQAAATPPAAQAPSPEPSYAASSGRASAPPPVQESDYQRVAWEGVSRAKNGAGRSYGVGGRSQAKLLTQLTALRDQAYREAGIG
jgi:hypothetical protein